MDYRKAAEALFEIVIMAVGMSEEVEAFNRLADKYPELLENYARKTEEETGDIELSEQTEERKACGDGKNV